MSPQQQTVEQASTVATYGGAATSIVFWGLSLSELGVIVSAVVALVGLVVSVVMAVRRDRRERALFNLRMGELRSDNSKTSRQTGKEARLD